MEKIIISTNSYKLCYSSSKKKYIECKRQEWQGTRFDGTRALNNNEMDEQKLPVL